MGTHVDYPARLKRVQDMMGEEGVDILIEAIASMRLNGVFKGYPFCLAVIGGDPDLNPQTINSEMARLQSLSEQFGVSDLVDFLGRRSQDTLPYYYSAAEAVVVPSHYESFGMVALEAMACGTPVVASEGGGLAFLVQDGKTGFTVPVDEPSALAERLSEVINKPDLRREMGKNAAAFAREYAWEKITGRVVKVYEEVLEGFAHP